MTSTEETLDIHSYIAMALRRKWYIIIPLVLCVVGSAVYYKRLPKIYRASTLILVQRQKIPTEYVQPNVADSVTNRSATLAQEILDQKRLETIINEFSLYADLRKQFPLEQVMEWMRGAIDIRVNDQDSDRRGQLSFSISYEGKEPQTVMQVTNRLASLFIEESQKNREQQAEKTSEFLKKELSSLEEKLRMKEAEIRAFKERHMGQLPEQQEANLRILERLDQQLQTTGENIKAAEDRAALARSQIDQLRQREQALLARQTRRESTPNVEDPGSDQIAEDPIITQYNQLKRDLAAAQSNYTENHPDVIALKKKIARLEPRVKDAVEKQKAAREARIQALRERRDATSANSEIDPAVATVDPALATLLAQYTEQYNESQLEARRLKGEEKNLKEQIVLYQRRLENTPRGEQELSTLTRDYELSKTSYHTLLYNKLQAEMAENLERKQQGEQFKVLDQARVPRWPVKPNRNKILMMGFCLGLALGAGLAWFRDSLDKSFHTVTDLESYMELPVLATIPNLKEEEKKAA